MNNKICEYDKEPVYYCPRCLSLEIKADINTFDRLKMLATSIFEWERMYEARYGFKFLENNY